MRFPCMAVLLVLVLVLVKQSEHATVPKQQKGFVESVKRAFFKGDAPLKFMKLGNSVKLNELKHAQSYRLFP